MTNAAKKGLLALLIILWAALILQRVVEAPEPQRVPLKFTSGQTLSREAARGTGGIPTVVQPGQAQAHQVKFKTPKNIFSPLTVKVKKSKRPRVVKKSKAPPAPSPVATAPPLPSPEELAAQQARQRMGQYRFLGYLERGGRQQAFIGKGRKIYIVRAGEMLDEQIRIQTVDASSVRLRDQGTSVEATLQLKKEGA